MVSMMARYWHFIMGLCRQLSGLKSPPVSAEKLASAEVQRGAALSWAGHGALHLFCEKPWRAPPVVTCHIFPAAECSRVGTPSCTWGSGGTGELTFRLPLPANDCVLLFFPGVGNCQQLQLRPGKAAMFFLRHRHPTMYLEN